MVGDNNESRMGDEQVSNTVEGELSLTVRGEDMRGNEEDRNNKYKEAYTSEEVDKREEIKAKRKKVLYWEEGDQASMSKTGEK